MGYPIILDLTDRPVLVIGAGRVATRRVARLLEEGADVTVISPEASDEIRAWADAGQITWQQRTYRPSDPGSAELILAETDDAALNLQITNDARSRGILANAATRTGSDFAIPSRLQKGLIQLAIDTGGAAPALAHELRVALDAFLEDGWAEAARILGVVRDLVARRADADTCQAFNRQAAKEIRDVLGSQRDVVDWLADLAAAHAIPLTTDDLRTALMG